MKAVVQRVLHASVTVNGRLHAQINQGFLILLGIAQEDTEADVDWLVQKISGLRVFSDDEGKMNRSIVDISGETLIVSQFTLLASIKKGYRPSFTDAARPEKGFIMYDQFVEKYRHSVNLTVYTGEFGANMQVTLCNNGPVTIILDSKNPV